MILAWPLHHLHLLVAQEEILLNPCSPMNLQTPYMEMVTGLVLQVAGFRHYREFHLPNNQNGKSSKHFLGAVWTLPFVVALMWLDFLWLFTTSWFSYLARTILNYIYEAANCDDLMLSFCNVSKRFWWFIGRSCNVLARLMTVSPWTIASSCYFFFFAKVAKMLWWLQNTNFLKHGFCCVNRSESQQSCTYGSM